ncbi:MAG: hypothetical protein JSS81_02400 [Acidobacteria bacterium]|nr:hypothetical protein [Acidobacteriota bacterium]
MKKVILTLILLFAATAAAQTEILTNAQIIEMSKAGLDKTVIIKKINGSAGSFDVSANGLIELKKGGVADEVIALMLEKEETKLAQSPPVKTDRPTNYSENTTPTEAQQFSPVVVTPKDALLNARTVAIEKSSLNPSRQSLEKELLKRPQWTKYNLTLVRYKQDADIYIEIGFVPFSLITHRYVFRIYDRRSGTIITAGETTSWGSLAHHLAREITQKMDLVSGKTN